MNKSPLLCLPDEGGGAISTAKKSHSHSRSSHVSELAATDLGQLKMMDVSN